MVTVAPICNDCVSVSAVIRQWSRPFLILTNSTFSTVSVCVPKDCLASLTWFAVRLRRLVTAKKLWKLQGLLSKAKQMKPPGLLLLLSRHFVFKVRTSPLGLLHGQRPWEWCSSTIRFQNWANSFRMLLLMRRLWQISLQVKSRFGPFHKNQMSNRKQLDSLMGLMGST